MVLKETNELSMYKLHFNTVIAVEKETETKV